MSSTEIDIDTLGLTPELRMMTEAFSSIPDEKTRHKQLLYMASKLADVGDDVRVPENKVPGCLSTVHVDCTAEEKEGEVVVNYVGDSDGLLTKGLLAMLIRGLSGCTPEQIAAVDPQFVKVAKISQTLTPGRNNGLLNMIAVMKKKASEATVAEANGGSGNATEDEAANGYVAPEEESEDAGDIVTSFEEIEGKPMYNAILSTLIPLLKPTSITLVDNSDQHAGHGGAKGWEESGESHFALDIVCEAFEGLNLVKRHQLIYMLLGEVMPKIHALEIRAKSTSEV
jgi:sulfur transfer protein SufE/stress-induced morphogen